MTLTKCYQLGEHCNKITGSPHVIRSTESRCGSHTSRVKAVTLCGYAPSYTISLGQEVKHQRYHLGPQTGRRSGSFGGRPARLVISSRMRPPRLACCAQPAQFQSLAVIHATEPWQCPHGITGPSRDSVVIVLPLHGTGQHLHKRYSVTSEESLA